MGQPDWRRHALLDARSAAPTIVAVCAAGIGPLLFRVWRTRRQGSVGARAARLRGTIGRVVDRPERVVMEPTVVQRSFVTAGSALVACLTKAALEHPWTRASIWGARRRS